MSCLRLLGARLGRGEPLAQGVLQDLAGRVAGHRVDQFELFGNGLDPQALALQVLHHVGEAERLDPPATATTAQARSPVFGSGRPMTATSATAGWA